MAKKGKTMPCAPATDDEWRVEDDLRALQTAAEVRKDSKRMAAVQKLCDKKEAAIKMVRGTAAKGFYASHGKAKGEKGGMQSAVQI